MMRFKSKIYQYVLPYSFSGFTIMEVLFTIVMIALIVTPLMFQQSTLVRRVDTYSRDMERMVVAQSFLQQARQQMQEYTTTFTLEKKIEDGDMTLKFSRGPVDKKSAFASLKGMVQDRVVMEWQEQGERKQDILTTFAYVQPQEKGSA